MKSFRWYHQRNFCSRGLQLSVLPWCRKRPQTSICCSEWLGVSSDRFKCGFVVFLYVTVLGPDIFSTRLRMKGHVLHHVRGHLKIPGWSLVRNALLTKKLPMFLSRLNESGSFWSNLKFFRMMGEMWGWMVVVFLYVLTLVTGTNQQCNSIFLYINHAQTTIP